MDVNKDNIERLLESTKKVFDFVSLPNGGILSALVGFKEYPLGLEIITLSE